MNDSVLHIDVATLKVVRDETQYRTIQAAKLGAAMLQLEALKTQVNRSLALSEQKQKEIVLHALKELGLDPSKEDFTVDEHGRVLRLVHGQYVPVRKGNGV